MNGAGQPTLKHMKWIWSSWSRRMMGLSVFVVRGKTIFCGLPLIFVKISRTRWERYHVRNEGNNHYLPGPKHKGAMESTPAKTKAPSKYCDPPEHLWCCERYCHDPDLNDTIVVKSPDQSLCGFDFFIQPHNWCAWLYFSSSSIFLAILLITFFFHKFFPKSVFQIMFVISSKVTGCSISQLKNQQNLCRFSRRNITERCD